MNKKKLILILTIIAILIASASVVSAGLFDSKDDKANIKTHEFNYANSHEIIYYFFSHYK